MKNDILGIIPKKIILLGILICLFSVLTLFFAFYVLFFDDVSSLTEKLTVFLFR